MSRSERQKGLDGEREVAALFAAAGFDVRNLEGLGDHLVVSANGSRLHVETKRQERLQLWQWLAQVKAETTRGTRGVCCFRRNHGEWYATLRLDDLIGLLR